MQECPNLRQFELSSFWINYGKFTDKLITTERRRNYLVSEPNYHTIKSFSENLLAIEMKNAYTY